MYTPIMSSRNKYPKSRTIIRDIAASLALLSGAFSAFAQTPPVITGPGGSSSAAFWYFHNISPSCCSDLVAKYYTQWTVYLTTNTSDPNPTIVWSTDSPTKVQITPTGTTGAQLTALDHSAAGTSYDINISVSVDGVSSANFPVFIDTAWAQTHSAPSSVGCPAVFGAGWNGWAGKVANQVGELTGTFNLTPIDATESFEHLRALYTTPIENWGALSATNWPVAAWSSNTFYDTYTVCWSGTSNPYTPAVVNWGTGTTTPVLSSTQKYWIGSLTSFQGQCSQRHDVTFNTNGPALSSVTTPVSSQGDCATGNGFLN